MADTFEEGLGRNPYISINQVKDYLSISSNTQDARLSNIVSYATSVVEHYIGQEIVENDYAEIFDGGTSSIYVNRLPLSNVYYVSEFNGVEHRLLNDPSTSGVPRTTSSDALNINFVNNASITTRTKKFGQSSLQLAADDYLQSSVVSSGLDFEESNFTVELFMRYDPPTLENKTIFEINTDENNYLKFGLANSYALTFSSADAGDITTINGANVYLESQQFKKKKWAHIAVTADIDNERLYLHYNGNTIANAAYTVTEHSFTTNVLIGSSFVGYIDELRVSSVARYSESFVPTSHRFRPDEDTTLLVHFDGKNNSRSARDVHAEVPEYTFAKDTGEITRDIGAMGIAGSFSSRRTYPSLTMAGPRGFLPFPNGVQISYRAGYPSTQVPYDLQLATLDYIKMLYKQDQEKQGFSFEGERGQSTELSGGFPPHIRRVLDMYRIIK